MAENNQVVYQYDIDGTRVSAALAKMRQEMQAFTTEFVQSQNRLQNTLQASANKYASNFKKLNDQFLVAVAKGDAELADRIAARIEKNTAKELSAAEQIRRQYAQGSPQTINRTVSQKHLLSNERGTLEALTASFNIQMGKLAESMVKGQPEVVTAHFKKATARTQQLLAQASDEALRADNLLAQRNLNRKISRANSPAGLAADDVLFNRRQEESIKRAQMGDGRYHVLKAQEKISANGGADFLAFQGNLMANYLILNQVYTALTSVTGAVITLDKELKNLQAITNASDGEMRVLSKTILDIGNKTRFSTTELAQAATVLGQAGLSAQQAGKALEGVSLLATAAGTDMASATDILTSTLTIFDLQAEKTGQVAQTLTAALNTSKLDIQKLGLGLQYAGNIAAQSSIPLEELVSILGALADSGVRGSTAGTGVRQLLLDLSTPSEKFLTILKRLNLSLVDVDIKSNGFVGVLNNLRQAGFSTSDALESFEVRAAAAFSALSNNAGAIDEMRQSLILSAAATTAAATQMESLTNVSLRLINTITSAAYLAFEPISDLLKTLISGAADGIAVLSEYPVILNGIGIALGAIVAVKGTVYIANMVAGFLGWQQVLSTLPAKLLTTTAAMNGLTVATTGTTVATTALSRASMLLAAHPVLLAITAVGAIISAITIWRSMQHDVNTELDNTKTRIAAMDEEISSASQSVQSISEDIHKLGQNSAALDKDQALGGGMLATRVLELKEAYAELGLELKTGITPTVNDLVDALNRLRTDIQGKLPDYIGQKLAEMETTMALLKQRTITGLGPDLVPDSAKQKGLLFGPNPGVRAEALGPDTVQALQLLLGNVELPTDNFEFSGLIKRLLDQARGTTDQRDKDILNDLAEAIRGLQAQIAEQQKLGIDIGRTQRLKLEEEVRLSTLGTRDSIDSLDTRSTNSINDVLRGTTDPVRIVEGMKRVRALYADELIKLSAELDAIEKALIAKGVSEGDAKNAVLATGLRDTLAKLDNAFKAAVEGRTPALIKIMKERNRIDESNNQKDLSRVSQKIRSARSKEELNALEVELNRLYDVKREIRKRVFSLDENTSPELLLAQQDALEQINADEKTTRDEIAERGKELGQLAADVGLELLEKQADVLREEIEKAKSGMTAKSPMEKIRQMVDLVNKLTDQLIGTEELIGQVKKSSFTPGVGTTFNGSASDVMKAIINGANQRGLDPVTALAIANLESGLNPNAKNPNSSASGIFQILNGTYDRLGIPAGDARRSSASGQINAGLDLMVLDQAQFQKLTGRKPNSYDQQLTHLLGANGYAKALENMSGNAIDVLGRGTVLGNGGNNSDTVATFLARMRGLFDTHLSKMADYTTTVADAQLKTIDAETQKGVSEAKGNAKEVLGILTKAESSLTARQAKEAAKAIEQEIETLSGQTRLLDEPENIKKMMEAIRVKFEKLIALELSAFDKENPGPENADERQDLVEQLLSRRDQSLSGLRSRYLDKVESNAGLGLERLKRSKDYADRVGNSDLALSLQQQIDDKETEYIKARVVALQREEAEANARLAEAIKKTGESSSSTARAQADLLEVQERLKDSQKEYNDAVGEGINVQQSNAQIIQATTRAWLEQSSLVDTVGEAWNSVLDGLSGAFTQLYTDLAEGNKSLKDSFKDFGRSVLKVFQDIFVQMAVMKTMQLLFGDMGGSGSGNILGNLLGGLFKRGTAVGTVGIPGRDSVPRLLQPGEAVLRKSAVDLIGADRLTEINNMGNRRLSQSKIQTLDASELKPSGGSVNVWVVSPDQVPPPSPSDIVAHVARDITTRGTLKNLIKSVQIGAI